MKPPWTAYPKIRAGSIEWRMGPGETYWDDFDKWYKRQTAEERNRYQKENPEPKGWDGFFDLKEKHLTSWEDAEKKK